MNVLHHIGKGFKVASTVKNANSAKRASTKPKKKEKQLKRVEKLEIFLGYFHITKYWIRVIPSFLVRENETDVRKCSSQISYDRLISLCSKLIIKSVKTLLPGPGFPKFRKDLFHRMCEGIGLADIQNNIHYCPDEEKISSVVSTLCNWSNKSKKRSIERRVLRAVLNKIFLTHEVKSFKSTYGILQGIGQVIQ